MKEGVRTVLASKHPIRHGLFEMQADLAKAAANAHVTQVEKVRKFSAKWGRKLGQDSYIVIKSAQLASSDARRVPRFGSVYQTGPR